MDPTHVTAEVLRRLEGGDWMGVAELHSEAFLAEFKSGRLARWSGAREPLTVETLGVQTNQEMEGLSAAEMYARHLQIADWRTTTLHHLELLQGRYPRYADQLEEEKKLLWRPWNVRVLGQVIDGTRAYVIYTEGSGRGTDHPWDFPPPVVTLRSTHGEWRISCDLGQAIGGGVIAAVAVRNEAGETIHLRL